MIPDAEALVTDYLLTDDDVEALVDDRIGGRPPHSTAEPWLRITQIGSPTVAGDSTDHLVTAHLQIDCYGGSDPDTAQSEASALQRTVRAVLQGMPDDDHDGAVVSRVTFGNGAGRVPDPDFEPARERFILDAFVTLHDAPGGS